MFCYIKEWPNKMATLMTSNGTVLCTCQNISEAQQVWRDWKRQQNPQISETTEAELQIVPYSPSPSVLEWLRTFVADYFERRNRKVVAG